MNRSAYETLELGHIREALASFAETGRGEEAARALTSSSEIDRVREDLLDTTETRRLHDEGLTVPLRGLPDVEPILDRVKIEGRSLDIEAFVALLTFCRIAGQARASLYPKDEDFPRLSALAGRIPDLGALDAAIREIVDPDTAMVRDDASPELSRLRARLERVRKKIAKHLEQVLSSRDRSKMLQEHLVTTRNGRSVVPVKAEHKSQFPGIVHGASASGATLFVEPMPVVEAGNELAAVSELELREVRRILAELTTRVRSDRDELKEALDVATALDLLQAKAGLSAAYSGQAPIVTEARELRLERAWHPLLSTAIAERAGLPVSGSESKPVPIRFHLSETERGLVFTGPNTGGKTVALKTAGLLSLMTQAGLHVPAASESVFPVFQTIFADIGDDQSISSSLSTFSAHLSKVVTMERELALPSLVILDEVGTGTDPAEGGALGTALVEHFLHRGALVLASTHHGLLKAYATTTEGIGTASFLFDPETYAPTYEVVEGAAGRSLAFEMSERLGLPKRIVTRARELQGERERQVGNLVERLEADSKELQQERERLASERQAAAHARSRIEHEEERERRERQKRLAEFRAELLEELDETRSKLRELVREAKRAASEVESSHKEQQRRLSELEKSVSKKLETVASPLLERVTPDTSGPESEGTELAPGTRVLATSFGMEGEIVRLEGDEAEVLVHDKKIRLPARDLEALSSPSAASVPSAPSSDRLAAEPKSTPSELNVVGCTVDEAIDRADKFLDDAFLSDHREVRLIHGHGTGRLKSALREWLETHPQVAQQKSDQRDGVTVVELKD